MVGLFIFDFVQQNDAVPLLKRMIGATVLFILALHFWLKRRSTDQGTPQIPKLLRAPWCIAGGIATMLANAAGPIMTVYMLSFRLTKEQFLGTMGWLFLILNIDCILL